MGTRWRTPFSTLVPPSYSIQWWEMPAKPHWSKVGEWQCATSQISPATPAVALATPHLYFCQSQQWVIFRGTMLTMELKKSEKAGTSVCLSLVNLSSVRLIYRPQLENLSREKRVFFSPSVSSKKSRTYVLHLHILIPFPAVTKNIFNSRVSRFSFPQISPEAGSS